MAGPLISLSCDMGEGKRLVWGPVAEELSLLSTSSLGGVTHQTEHRFGLVRLCAEKEQSAGLESVGLESPGSRFGP